ncbi:polysaccharide biosynthesis protein [Acetobacteraceae bacterium H6797]|nr:polysaccharide biosynthesis protein [Acetobacteraceae bacterium H6797]
MSITLPHRRQRQHVALDSLLALLALPIALTLASPQDWHSARWWGAALPGMVLCFWLVGLPLRLPEQSWRQPSLADLLSLAGAALISAMLFASACALLDAPASANPSFPAIHALTMGAMLGLARMLDMLRAQGAPPPAQPVRAPEVSLEQLLDRPQVPLDREGMARLIQGRRVLVTGAGGTIGGELARQLAALAPERLVLLDHGEFALYQINLELSESFPAVHRHAVIADIRDAARIARLMENFRPELVFHAAALKHVPMVESDPLEGLLTNALGTRIVADAARAAGCRAMVFISTDKAVNPSSVMGASKRLAEMYCQGLDRQARSAGGMRCVTVRFGNVLGSTGSVVPLFRRQLERGGPLTVTHPDMRRYFMTVREAVGLVLQASLLGTEDRADQPPQLREGGIFVLDMGKPVKIVDMARRMIRLAGLIPDKDVQIRFTGLRPGEKLFEELFHGQEPALPTLHDGLLIATPRSANPGIVSCAIDEIAEAARAGRTEAALARLGGLIPEFTPQQGAKPRLRVVS